MSGSRLKIVQRSSPGRTSCWSQYSSGFCLLGPASPRCGAEKQKRALPWDDFQGRARFYVGLCQVVIQAWMPPFVRWVGLGVSGTDGSLDGETSLSSTRCDNLAGCGWREQVCHGG